MISCRQLLFVFFVVPFFFTSCSLFNQRFDVEQALLKQSVIPFLVVGSGPAGLSAALYGARGNIPVTVMAGNEPGGLLTKTTEVTNWPGRSTVQGPDLIDAMTDQVKSLGVTIMDDHVVSIDTTSWPYAVTTQDGNRMHALSIILAMGARPKVLEVPGEKKYWGNGVTTCAVCDAPFYKNEDVVVVGGGDSAVEEALQVAQYARSVKVLVRKGAMRAAERMQMRLKEYDTISVVYYVEVKEVLGDGERVTGVRLFNNKKNEMTTISATGFFLAIGHIPNSREVFDAVSCDSNGYIVRRPSLQETSIRGIYAAGEVTDYQYRQAITSASDGAKAALEALEFLREIGITPAITERIMLMQKKSL